MNSSDFETAVNLQLSLCQSTLVRKAGEYATDVDRLHSFKVSAELQGVSPKEALAGMMAKHTTSVYDLIRREEPVSLEMWTEKITDHINYLLILKAMVSEEDAHIQNTIDELRMKLSGQENSNVQEDD